MSSLKMSLRKYHRDTPNSFIIFRDADPDVGKVIEAYNQLVADEVLEQSESGIWENGHFIRTYRLKFDPYMTLDDIDRQLNDLERTLNRSLSDQRMSPANQNLFAVQNLIAEAMAKILDARKQFP